jgi:hypothetical protein
MTSAREAVAQEVRRAVRVIGPSVIEAAEELHVTRQTVYRWLRGDIPYERLDQLAAMVGTLTIRIGPDDRASWPEWARTLDEKMDALLSDAALAESLREARRTVAPPADDAGPVPQPGSPSDGQ